MRAEKQVRDLYRETGEDYASDVRDRYGSKREGRAAKTKLIERFRGIHGKDTLPGNKTNR